MKNSFTFRRFAKLAAIPAFALAAISCTDTTDPTPSGALVVVNANSSLNQLQLRIDDQTNVFGQPLAFNTRCCLDINGSPTLLIPALDTVREIAFYNGTDTTTILRTNLTIEHGVTYFFIVARDPVDGSPILREYEGNQDPINDYTLIRFVNASYQSHLVAGGIDIYITDSTVTNLNDPLLLPEIADLNYMEDRGYYDLRTPERKFKVFITPTGQRNNVQFTETYETTGFNIMTPGTVRTVFMLNGASGGVEAFPLSPFIVGF